MNEDLRPSEDEPEVGQSSRWDTVCAFVEVVDAATRGATSDRRLARRADAVTLAVRPDGLSWEGRHLPVSEGATDWRRELFRGGVGAITVVPVEAGVTALAGALTAPLPPGTDRATFLAEAAPDAVAVTRSHARPRDLGVDLDGAVRLGRDRPAPGVLRPTAPLHLAPAPSGGVDGAHAGTARALREALADDLDAAAALRRALVAPGGARPGLAAALWDWASNAEPRSIARLLSELPPDGLGWATAPARLPGYAAALATDPAPVLAALRPALADRPDDWLALADAAPTPEAREAVLAEADPAGADLSAFHAARLNADDVAVVLDAVAALERAGGPDVPALLAPALSHPDAAVRRAALQALAGRWSEALRAPVVARLSDPDPDCRAAAVALAAASGDRRVAGALLALARRPDLLDRPDDERAALLDALARFDDGRVAAWFADLLGNPNLTRKAALTRAQVQAIEALQAAGGRSAARLLGALQPRWHQPAALKAAIHRARESG